MTMGGRPAMVRHMSNGRNLLSPEQVSDKLAKSTRLPGSLPVLNHFYPSTRFF